MKLFTLLLLFTTTSFVWAQTNSNTRNLINKANLSLIERDQNHVAILKSGIGETVTFFPIEITDLKTEQTIKALQVDMAIGCMYAKSSWVDYDEIAEFITFLDKYVMPRFSVNTSENISLTYVFSSKEIMVQFEVGDNNNRLSIFLKNNDGFDGQCYFWTETQIGKTQELLAVLQSFKP